MRRYAAVYRKETGKFRVIFQDDNDYSPGMWYDNDIEIADESATQIIINSLNRED